MKRRRRRQQGPSVLVTVVVVGAALALLILVVRLWPRRSDGVARQADAQRLAPAVGGDESLSAEERGALEALLEKKQGSGAGSQRR